MSHVNFKLLHIFIAIADNKEFKTCVGEANRSKAAVSMQFKQLRNRSAWHCFTGPPDGSN